MRIGIPREIKSGEHRVAASPSGVASLTRAGHEVLVEAGAGEGSSMPDQAYVDAGATIVDTAEEVWAKGDLLLKVKEPIGPEFGLMRPDQILFTYLHLAAAPECAQALLDAGTTSVAYETVTDDRGELPLLTPMSQVAGRLAVQVGAYHLMSHFGGRGILLPGVPGTRPARVTVIGAGQVGASAVAMAHGLRADVTVLDLDPRALKRIDDIYRGTVDTVFSTAHEIEQELLQAAVSLEARSEHPLAAAIMKRGEEAQIQPEAAEDFAAITGSGLKATVLGAQLLGGSVRYMASQLALPQEMEKQADALSQAGKTPLLFAKNGRLLGLIAVADAIKPESPEAIRQLRGMGIRVVMLTGDNARTAAAIGKLAGVDDVVAGVLPGGKEAVIRELQKYGPVAMVGDGINDAPALTAADTGIAIGAGADVAIDAADVVLMKSTLLDVPAAIRLSRAALRNIHENLFWAFIYNVIGIPLAAGVFVGLGLTLNPMYGAAAMSLSSFCVVSNALRLNLCRLYDPKHDHKGDPLPEFHLADQMKEEATMTKTLHVKGMMCGHCEARVKKALEAVDGVQSAVADHTAGTAVVTLTKDVAADVLKSAVEAQDYEVTGVE